jgi:hypothetical protein
MSAYDVYKARNLKTTTAFTNVTYPCHRPMFVGGGMSFYYSDVKFVFRESLTSNLVQNTWVSDATLVI